MATTADREWHLLRDGRQYGPITDRELRDLVRAGQVGNDDYVWCSGFTDWVRFASVAGTALPAASAGSGAGHLHSLRRFLFRRLIAERASAFRKIVLIVREPAEFARRFIRDGDRHALFEAVKFYVKVFALVFAAKVVADHFSFVQGGSEARALVVRLLPQVVLGTMVLFALLRATGNRVPIDGLLQAILYVDAVYLIFDALLNIPLAYLDHALRSPGSSKEIDLLATEFESCLASESVLYWLVRGDVQFFMQREAGRSWVQSLVDHRRYLTAVPFLLLFAHVLRSKYRVNLAVAVLAAAIAFIGANETYDWTERKARHLIARQQDCETKYVNTLLDKHAIGRIARQLEVKLGDSLTTAVPGANKTFRLEGTEYVVVFKLAGDVVDEVRLSLGAAALFRSVYCGGHPYWVVVRRMSYSLAAFVLQGERAIVSMRLTPSDCPWSGRGS